MKYFKYILCLAIFLFIVFLGFGFSIMNSDLVTLSVLPSIAFDLSLAAVVFATFIVGLVLGAMLVSLSLIGQKMKTRKINRKLKKIESEVEGLRSTNLEQA